LSFEPSGVRQNRNVPLAGAFDGATPTPFVASYCARDPAISIRSPTQPALACPPRFVVEIIS
jgi:hypothetical protein